MGDAPDGGSAGPLALRTGGTTGADVGAGPGVASARLAAVSGSDRRVTGCGLGAAGVGVGRAVSRTGGMTGCVSDAAGPAIVLPACWAAPSATASLGLASTVTGCPTASLIIWATIGIRAEPPTSSTEPSAWGE